MSSSMLGCLRTRWPPNLGVRAASSVFCAWRSHLYPLAFYSTAANFEYKCELFELVENLANYRPGGYHPVVIDDRLDGRYRIVHKLGHGTFSTVWLALDERTGQYVAVKVGIADAPRHEIDVLSRLAKGAAASGNTPHGASMIPVVKDSFTVNGPNGSHPCLVTIPARCSLADAKEEGGRGLFQLDVARSLAAQLILAVAFIHSKGYCHGDLHLGNLLLQLPSSLGKLSVEELYTEIAPPMPSPVVSADGSLSSISPSVPSHLNPPLWLGEEDGKITVREAKLLLSDFGTAFRPSEQSTFKSHTPLTIRPPEAFLEPTAPLSFGSDIWSLGCVIFELFAPCSLIYGFMTTQDDITAQQVVLQGPMPKEWWARWEERCEWFDETGKPLREPGRAGSLDNRFEELVQNGRKYYGYPTVSDDEKAELVELLRRVLAWRPAARPSAQELLDMRWVKKWGLPAYEASRGETN